MEQPFESMISPIPHNQVDEENSKETHEILSSIPEVKDEDTEKIECNEDLDMLIKREKCRIIYRLITFFWYNFPSQKELTTSYVFGGKSAHQQDLHLDHYYTSWAEETRLNEVEQDTFRRNDDIFANGDPLPICGDCLVKTYNDMISNPGKRFKVTPCPEDYTHFEEMYHFFGKFGDYHTSMKMAMKHSLISIKKHHRSNGHKPWLVSRMDDLNSRNL